MAIEIYRNKRTDLSSIDKILNAQEERITLLKKLGLKAQLADLVYPKLTPEELAVWEKFLPRKYSSQNGSIFLETRHYSFDEIPCEILREWDHAQCLDIFDTFYIRTPEKAYIDPILLGHISKGRDWWLIARWGESLLPFNKIRELVSLQNSNPQKVQTWFDKFLFGPREVGAVRKNLS